MKIFLSVIVCLGVLFVGFAAYVRVAPTDPSRWHVDPETAADPGGRGVIETLVSARAPQEALSALDTIIMATPRTTLIAGDVASGMVTYEVRSKVMRFPDYVTVKAKTTPTGSALIILSRARFGQSDLGVNAARLTGWFTTFEAQN